MNAVITRLSINKCAYSKMGILVPGMRRSSRYATCHNWGGVHHRVLSWSRDLGVLNHASEQCFETSVLWKVNTVSKQLFQSSHPYFPLLYRPSLEFLPEVWGACSLSALQRILDCCAFSPWTPGVPFSPFLWIAFSGKTQNHS